jgi:hypothetical protein
VFDLLELNQFLRIRHRKPMQEDVIEHGKHRGIGADAERQGEDGYRGEDGRFRQRPDGITQFTWKAHRRSSQEGS